MYKFIAEKVKKALDSKLSVVACIGELLSEREQGKTMDVCQDQLSVIREQTTDWSNIVIAYEPVWAIGTGVTASPEQAQEVHEKIRAWISKNVNTKTAESVRILYGGSVTEKNASELIMKKDIDGFLVGGASLKPGFTDIVKACNYARK